MTFRSPSPSSPSSPPMGSSATVPFGSPPCRLNHQIRILSWCFR
ncbi:unnamed protein product [Brassica napus]|uniref:(rape) hypothetical protein n=1 Tax=Brassica napus TaxID=3708 RepID=A0A817AD24_BRANA|nr:unnamed protein product [Brassica napus]